MPLGTRSSITACTRPSQPLPAPCRLRLEGGSRCEIAFLPSDAPSAMRTVRLCSQPPEEALCLGWCAECHRRIYTTECTEPRCLRAAGLCTCRLRGGGMSNREGEQSGWRGEMGAAPAGAGGDGGSVPPGAPAPQDLSPGSPLPSVEPSHAWSQDWVATWAMPVGPGACPRSTLLCGSSRWQTIGSLDGRRHTSVPCGEDCLQGSSGARCPGTGSMVPAAGIP